MASFQAVALGHSVATAAKTLRASHPSKRVFPDVALRVFCELADGMSSTASAVSAKLKATSAASTKPAAAGAVQGPSPSPSRTISLALLRELVGYLTAEFPKRIQAQVLQRLIRPDADASGNSEASETVGFKTFLRFVDACLLLEELMDAANELFRLLQAQQQQSEGLAGAATESLATQLENALEAAASQTPQHRELLRELLSPPANDSGASSRLPPPVTTAADVQEVLLRLIFDDGAVK